MYKVSERDLTMVKILVIDDESTLRQTITAILDYAGYDVINAADGHAGVQMAREHLPDLIVSDIVMPGLDGYGLLTKLRENPMTDTIPVIFVTALADRDAMRQGMSLGADDYLIKPFEPADLLDTVEIRLRRQALLSQRHDSTLKNLRKNIIYALPHEMRTPLHLILGFAQILEMYHDSVPVEDVLQASQAIITAGRRLEHLIENYLAYAQMEVISGDPEEMQALRNHMTSDPDRVIHDAAQMQAEIHHRVGDLRFDLCKRSLHIAEESLSKIVSEVVDNAFKFSEPGQPVRVYSVIDQDCFVLNVADKGRGMSPKDIESIGAYMQFERALFEQQGLGLGLALVYRLAELHGGSVHVESKPDRGTHIQIYLPL